MIRRDKIKNSNGFTLVEMLLVITIMGILAVIAVPSVTKVMNSSKERVCSVNVSHLKSMYEGHLSIEGLPHSDVAFQQYVDNYGYGNELCPEHGEITYVDGEVYCSVHSP